MAQFDNNITSDQDTLDSQADAKPPADDDVCPGPAYLKGYKPGTVSLKSFPAGEGAGSGFQLHSSQVLTVVGAMGQDNGTLSQGQNEIEDGYALAASGGSAWQTIADFTTNAFSLGSVIAQAVQAVSSTYEDMTTALSKNMKRYADTEAEIVSNANRV